MKRSGLKVGEAYYYDRSNNWLDGAGVWRTSKAVVVNVGWWETVEHWRRLPGEPPYRQVRDGTRGAGVLVDLYDGDGSDSKPSRTVVATAHLRGLYEETAAEVAEAARKRREATDAAQAARRERDSLAAAAFAQARPLGLSASCTDWERRSVDVPTHEFAAMVAALAEAGWRYESTGKEADRG